MSKRQTLTVIFLIAAASNIVFAQTVATGKSRDERWREDVRFFAQELPLRHKNLFFKLPKAEFERQVKQLENNIPKLSDTQIYIELTALTARSGDAHTGVSSPATAFSFFPFSIFRFQEGWFVLSADEQNAEILGAQLVKIGDTPIEKAVLKIRDFIPAENEYRILSRLPSYLQIAEFLEARDILPRTDSGKFTFVKTDGRTVTVEMKSLSESDLEKVKFVNIAERIKLPLALSRGGFYWYEYLPEAKTVFIAYNRCEQDAAKPFLDFVNEAFAVADREKAEKIVIDLRRNRGGNSLVLFPLYQALRVRQNLTAPGKIFALVGRNTFSSAFMNAHQLKLIFGAILVGEPSGQSPNAYGELKSFVLPNSKLKVNFSTEYFELIKGEKRPFLPVDIPVERTFADFAAGRDAALEAVLKYLK